MASQPAAGGEEVDWSAKDWAPPGGLWAPPPGQGAAAGARRPRVLVGASGSVAAIKLPELCSLLHAAGCDLRLVATSAAARFLASAPAPLPECALPVMGDEAEWTAWRAVGARVLALAPRAWGALA